MTKSKNTKRALLASVISLMLCVAMLIGTTFAWFTDSVTTGKSRIVGGNLKIDLQAKMKGGKYDKDGEYASIDKTKEILFGGDILWEPGQVHYRELKVVNKGTLAAKISTTIDPGAFKVNYVLEPLNIINVTFNDNDTILDSTEVEAFLGENEDLDTEAYIVVPDEDNEVDPDGYNGKCKVYVRPSELYKVIDALEEGELTFTVDVADDGNYEYAYMPTINALPDIIRYAFWNGGDFESLKAAVKGKVGESNLPKTDREYVKAALENDLITGDSFNLTDESIGSVFEDDLLLPGAEKKFTLIAYWAMEGDEMYEFNVDNDFNLNNLRKATTLLASYEINDFFAETDDKVVLNSNDSYISDDPLQLEFDVKVYATQTPYEPDSFGTEYDEGLDIKDVFGLKTNND